MDFIAPNTGNLSILKAEIYFTPTGGVRRHMGNVPSATFAPDIQELEHFSSMAGIRSKDKVVALQVGGTVTLELEEKNRYNMALAVLADIGDGEVDTEGNFVLDILTQTTVAGRLEIIATNDVGPRWSWDFPNVSFRPTGDHNLIDADDWNSFTIEGEVLTSATGFGKISLQGGGVAPETE